MIDGVKPYSEYKDSGVPWLGEVPAHWKVLPHRALFQEVNERDHPDEPLLSVTIARGVIPQEVLLANSSKKDSSNLDKSNYKLVQPGDITYNKMRAWQGALGVSQYRGIVSPAYIVVRPRRKQVPEYYHYLFRTPMFTSEAERWSYGITSDQWSLRSEDFKRIYGLLPPIEEQAAIARFLTRFDQITRRYVHAQRRLIELLEEQKQALIQRAVTRGLDPDVPLKDSGIEWIGKIPGHWRITTAKRVSRVFIPQRDKPDLNEKEGLPWVTPECMGDKYVKQSNSFVDHQHIALTGIRTVPALSVIASCVGRFGIASINKTPIVINQQLQAFIPSHQIDKLFLRYATLIAKPYFDMTGNATTLSYVDRQGFQDMPLPLPPLSEQREIAIFVEQEEARIIDAMEMISRQIDLVREYRTRLIADVVTGKLDVRDVVLPDLGDKSELLYNEEDSVDFYKDDEQEMRDGEL